MPLDFLDVDVRFIVVLMLRKVSEFLGDTGYFGKVMDSLVLLRFAVNVKSFFLRVSLFKVL